MEKLNITVRRSFIVGEKGGKLKNVRGKRERIRSWLRPG